MRSANIYRKPTTPTEPINEQTWEDNWITLPAALSNFAPQASQWFYGIVGGGSNGIKRHNLTANILSEGYRIGAVNNMTSFWFNLYGNYNFQRGSGDHVILNGSSNQRRSNTIGWNRYEIPAGSYDHFEYFGPHGFGTSHGWGWTSAIATGMNHNAKFGWYGGFGGYIVSLVVPVQNDAQVPHPNIYRKLYRTGQVAYDLMNLNITYPDFKRDTNYCTFNDWKKLSPNEGHVDADQAYKMRYFDFDGDGESYVQRCWVTSGFLNTYNASGWPIASVS